jgi:NAD(P)-dependent dehydrogenase (short-subunit alcohol dehydrogenase family)
MAVALAARDVDKLADLASETGGRVFACDVKSAEAVNGVFNRVEAEIGATDLVVFNASARYRAPLTELAADRVCSALMTGAFGGFLVGQAAARAMLPRGHGSIFFTGATASVKGVSGSAPFAMQKFALRGLAQSMAREFQPQGLHIAHFVIDGGIASGLSKSDETGTPDRWLDPDAIARTYLDVHRQHRSAWTSEVELRPWVEKF